MANKAQGEGRGDVGNLGMRGERLTKFGKLGLRVESMGR